MLLDSQKGGLAQRSQTSSHQRANSGRDHASTYRAFWGQALPLVLVVWERSLSEGRLHARVEFSKSPGRFTAPTHVFETQCPSLENPAAERSLVGRLAFFRSSQSKTNCGRESEVMFMNVAPDSRRKRRPYFIRSLVRRVPCSCAYWRDAYVYVLAFPLSPAGYGTYSLLGADLSKLPGVSGTAAADGRYSGTFSQIDVLGKAGLNRGVSSFAVTRKSLLSWLNSTL